MNKKVFICLGILIFCMILITIFLLTKERFTDIVDTGDCIVSEWSEWSTCNQPCNGGTQTRVRTIVKDGKDCPNLHEVQPCNREPCRPVVIFSYLKNQEIYLAWNISRNVLQQNRVDAEIDVKEIGSENSYTDFPKVLPFTYNGKEYATPKFSMVNSDKNKNYWVRVRVNTGDNNYTPWSDWNTLSLL